MNSRCVKMASFTCPRCDGRMVFNDEPLDTNLRKPVSIVYCAECGLYGTGANVKMALHAFYNLHNGKRLGAKVGISRLYCRTRSLPKKKNKVKVR